MAGAVIFIDQPLYVLILGPIALGAWVLYARTAGGRARIERSRETQETLRRLREKYPKP